MENDIEISNEELLRLDDTRRMEAIEKMSTERIDAIDPETLVRLNKDFGFIRGNKIIKKMSRSRVNQIDNTTLLKMEFFTRSKVLKCMTMERVDGIDDNTLFHLNDIKGGYGCLETPMEVALRRMSDERFNNVKIKDHSNISHYYKDVTKERANMKKHNETEKEWRRRRRARMNEENKVRDQTKKNKIQYLANCSSEEFDNLWNELNFDRSWQRRLNDFQAHFHNTTEITSEFVKSLYTKKHLSHFEEHLRDDLLYELPHTEVGKEIMDKLPVEKVPDELL